MFSAPLNVQKLHEIYAHSGLISIQNVFREDVATEINLALKEMSWHLEIKDNTGRPTFRIPITEVHEPKNLAMAFEAASYELDQDDMFFMRLCANVDEFDNKILSQFTEFLDSKEFLAPMRAITGIDHAGSIWSEATCYDRSCFLATHDDSHVETNLAAFVINFTRAWRLDWGGLLTLHQQAGMQPLILAPIWNSLNIFTVPANHFVSSVSLAATEKRYAITGWLRP